jgi:hypothetical protein
MLKHTLLKLPHAKNSSFAPHQSLFTGDQKNKVKEKGDLDTFGVFWIYFLKKTLHSSKE